MTGHVIGDEATSDRELAVGIGHRQTPRCVDRIMTAREIGREVTFGDNHPGVAAPGFEMTPSGQNMAGPSVLRGMIIVSMFQTAVEIVGQIVKNPIGLQKMSRRGLSQHVARCRISKTFTEANLRSVNNRFQVLPSWMMLVLGFLKL